MWKRVVSVYRNYENRRNKGGFLFKVLISMFLNFHGVFVHFCAHYKNYIFIYLDQSVFVCDFPSQPLLFDKFNYIIIFNNLLWLIGMLLVSRSRLVEEIAVVLYFPNINAWKFKAWILTFLFNRLFLVIRWTKVL